MGVEVFCMYAVIWPQALYSRESLTSMDYPLAFGALGISGFFWKKKHGLVKGYIAGIIGRYFFAVLSGWLFFGAYAWEGWNPLAYSLVYNACYIFTEGAVTILVISIPSVSKALLQIKRQAQES